jgi:acetyl-CoA C-acetyltransferase
MLATAERVAADGAIAKDELDELAVRRYEQYLDALADDRAFQREWMIPIVAGSRRKPVTIDEDSGVRPIVLDELRALNPVKEGGVVSYGTQTHPADGSAGRVVTSPSVLEELGVEGPVAHLRATGFARVDPGTMPKAPVPAARAALRDAGIGIEQVDVIKTHNPFAVNDVWFAREFDIDANELNPFGSSLVYGHPQAPTGARGIVELLHALVRRGGGVGLFTGCAAGDTGAAVVVEVDG